MYAVQSSCHPNKMFLNVNFALGSSEIRTWETSIQTIKALAEVPRAEPSLHLAELTLEGIVFSTCCDVHERC